MRVGLLVSGAFPLDGFEPVDVETPWGETRVHVGGPGRSLVAVRRHGEPALPPHRVRHRANVDALRACGVERVLGVHSVGALKAEIPSPSFVVPDDLVDFTNHPESTFFEDRPVHVAMDPPYCPEARAALLASAREDPARLTARDGGTYVMARGPRLETVAEIRALALLGDVVGMTAGPEATLCRERGLCHASLSVVVNAAAGLGAPLAANDIFAGYRRVVDAAARIATDALLRLPPVRACGCRDAPKQAGA